MADEKDSLIELADADDGAVDVLFLDETATEEPDVPFAEDSPNLVLDHQGDEDWDAFFVKAGDQVEKHFDTAWESTEEYRQKIADNFKIYAGFLPRKDWPFEGCSNIHIPIMLEGITRLSSRAYSELFLNDDQVFDFQPMTPEFELAAQAITYHTNWQIWNQITDFTRQMHRGLVIFYTVGDLTSHSFWDPIKRCNRHEILTCDEFVVPYVMVTTEPDYSDVPYKTKILSYQGYEIEQLRGDWANVDDILARKQPSYDDEPAALLREAHAAASGIALPDDDDNAPYKFYLYDGYMKLPGEDFSRAVQAIWDPHTRVLAKLFIREEPDWRDQIRYDREVEQGRAYGQAMDAWNAEQEQIQALQDRMAQPGVDEFEAGMVQEALNQDALPPPPVPRWMEDGKMTPDLPRRVPIEMFAHGVCMENFLGNLGLSYGQILADENRAINNNWNQFNDQASMSNASSWIVPDIVDIEPGTINYQPGSVTRVSNIGPNELKNSFIELKPSAANQQLIEAANKMYEIAQSSVGASDLLGGEPGKSGETYRGAALRLEQILKQLSVSGRKFADFLVQVGRNNAKLNAMYLEDDELFYVTQKFQRMGQPVMVSPDMYAQNYKVSIRADLRFASQAQRIAEADEMVALPKMIPPLAQNLAWWYGAAEKSVKARGMHDMLPLLGQRPPDPKTPLGIMPMMPQPGGPPGAAPPQPGPPGPPGGPPEQ